MRDKLAPLPLLPDILSRSVAATKLNDPLTHRTHDERTKGRNAMRASRFLELHVVATERGTRQPVLSVFKLQRATRTSTPCRYSQAEVWKAKIWKAKLIDIVK